MRKVVFFINTKMYDSSTDFRNLQDGNPGIGGTEYIMLLVAQNLFFRNNNIDIEIYLTKDGIYCNDLHYKIISSIENAIIKASDEGADYFVFDHKLYPWFSNNNARIKSKMKLIPWCHTFALPEESQAMAKHPNIGRIIAVGSEQRDLYRDDRSFYFTNYIFNCVPVSPFYVQKAFSNPNRMREHIVTYIGSIIEGKTFHVLARLWPRITERIPDAQLYVIGSGMIYDKKELGDYGIASKNYEEIFMPYLTDKDGRVLDSVHFMGAMGIEKNDILLKTKVGVPNPTGKSETFCISAVEMQVMGCSVTAIKAPGYLDTIYNGYIAKNEEELLNNIVLLLENECPKSQLDTFSYIQKHFSLNSVLIEWEKLLLGNYDGHQSPIVPIKNIFFRKKWLKEIIRYIKIVMPFLNKYKFTVEGHYQKKIVDKDYKLRG